MPFVGELRPYQREAVNAMLKRGNALVAYDMGLGKTPTTIYAIERLIDTGRAECCLVVVPASLKYQWRDQLKVFAPDASVGVVDGPKKARQEVYHRAQRWMYEYVILGYEQLLSDGDAIADIPYEAMVIDECFPGWVLVDTPGGKRRIDSLRPGDVVRNCIGTGTVRKVMQRRTDVIAEVALEHRAALALTPNHPVLTQRGWVAAGALEYGDEVVTTSEAVRVVRPPAPCGNHCVHSGGLAPTSEQEPLLQQVLLGEVEDVPTIVGSGVHAGAIGQAERVLQTLVARASRRVGKVRQVESRTCRDGRDASEGICIASSDRASAEGATRQRHGSDGNRSGVARRAGQPLAVESRRSDAAAKGLGVPDELQDRLGAAEGARGGGGGRQLALDSGSPSCGCEEDFVPRRARVVGVAVHERGSARFAELCGEDGEVFNIEVSGHPSYSVAGLAVHNCTAIKSFKAQRTRAVKRMNPKYRFALSGQPVENRPEELFSIMQWVDPNVLGNFVTFDRAFIVRNHWGAVKRYRNLHTLRKRVIDTGAVLRKTRHDDDVAPYMPDVTELSMYPTFNDAARQLYGIVGRSLLEEIELLVGFGETFDLFAHYSGDANENEAKGRVMQRMLALRMLCDHPRLLRWSATEYDKGAGNGSAYIAELRDRGLLDKLGDKSPKLELLVAEVLELLDADPKTKIVVFSTFKQMLRYIADRFDKVGHVIYDGDMNAKQKDAAKKTFENDPHCRLFLSSDAGGYGLDLPNANYLFSFDLPWSAGKLDQRNSRIIRSSSQFGAVVVVNLLVDESIEVRQYGMLSQKRAVASAWLDGKNLTGKSGSITLDLGTLREFLEGTV